MNEGGEFTPIDERSMQERRWKKEASYSDSMIVVAPRVHRKIMYWVQGAILNGKGTEISGLMRIRRIERDIPGVDSKVEDIHVVDAVLLPQECSGGYTEMSEEGLAKFLVPLMKKGRHIEWSGWWHSHNDFGVFFSGIDSTTAIKHGFIASVVFNRYGQMYGQTNEGPIETEALTVVRPIDRNSRMRQEAKIEVKAKVKEIVYVEPRKTKRHFRSGANGGDDGFAYRSGGGGEFRGAYAWEDGAWVYRPFR